jgi:hypothetical protein
MSTSMMSLELWLGQVAHRLNNESTIAELIGTMNTALTKRPNRASFTNLPPEDAPFI